MLLINHGTIYTMEGPVYEDGYILCEGKTILEVGERWEESRYYRTACTNGILQGGKADCVESGKNIEEQTNDRQLHEIDATGCIVTPGLIEAHCHVGITEEKKGIEGDDCNEVTNPVTPHLRAIDAINPMDAAFQNALKAGITGLMIGPGSANVVGGQFAFVKTHGRRIDDMIVKAPAAMKVAFGENPKTNYGNQGNMPSTRMGIAALLREELTKASNYLQQKKEGKIEQPDIRMEAWEPVFRGEIPLKAHVHRTDDILTAIRIGKEFGLGVTLDHCSEGHLIWKEIADSGYPAIVGPAMTSRNKIEVQYVDFKTPGELAHAGVATAITTDHPVTLIQYLPLCAGMARKKGMTFMEALSAITITAARICRVDDRVGSLRAGKDADIAIFDGNPMEVFTENKYTILNGTVVWDAAGESGA